jgi:hypothetical protein
MLPKSTFGAPTPVNIICPWLKGAFGSSTVLARLLTFPVKKFEPNVCTQGPVTPGDFIIVFETPAIQFVPFQTTDFTSHAKESLTETHVDASGL